MSPRAPQPPAGPPDADPNLQMRLFDPKPPSGRMALEHAAVIVGEGPEAAPITEADAAKSPDDPETIMNPIIAQQILSLEARHSAFDSLAEEAMLKGNVDKLNRQIHKLTVANSKLRDPPFDQDKRVVINRGQKAKQAQLKTSQDARDQKKVDAKLNLGISLGIDAIEFTVPKTDIERDPVIDKKTGEIETQQIVVAPTEQEQIFLDQEFVKFWNEFAGPGQYEERPAVRDEQRQAIKKQIKDLKIKAIKDPVYQTLGARKDLLQRVQNIQKSQRKGGR